MYKIRSKNCVSKPFYTSDIWNEKALRVEVLRSDGKDKVVEWIDAEKAREVKGITSIITFDQYPRLIDEDIAIIAGRDRESVQRAMDLIQVRYREVKPRRQAKNYDSLYLELGSSDIRFERSYRIDKASEYSVETARAYTYIDQGNRLVVMSPTESPRSIQKELGDLLGISQSKIRVIRPRMAGGYGEKSNLLAEYYTAIVTLETEKPSSYLATFKEVKDFFEDKNSTLVDIGLSLSKEGSIIKTDIGLRTTLEGESLEEVAGPRIDSPYDLGRLRVFKQGDLEVDVQQVNAFLEMALGEAAESLKLDQAKVKRRNLSKEKAVARQLLKLADSYVSNSKKSISINRDLSRMRGMGISLVNQSATVPSKDSSTVTIKFIEDGSFTLLLDSNYLGFGMESIIRRICGSKLGIGESGVTLISGDTDITQFRGARPSSNSLYAIDGALEIACNKILEELKLRASKYLQVEGWQIDFKGEGFEALGKTVGLKELGRYLVNTLDQVYVCESYDGVKVENSYGAIISEVEVDSEIGSVEVKSVKAYYDIGRPIDHRLSTLQLEGALFRDLEQSIYRSVESENQGVPLNFMDIPKLEVELVDSNSNYKEFRLTSSALSASIQEAIWDAIGIRVNQFPITSEQVFKEHKALSNKFSSNYRGGFVKWQ